MNIDALRRLIRFAAAEDLGDRGDITAALLPEDTTDARFDVVARQAGVFAGARVFPVLTDELCPDADVVLADAMTDGITLSPGRSIATVTGPAGAILSAERTLLNFLQRLCGVATLTRAYVDAVAATGARIYDTRKTVPAWRDLDKYAVRSGGGHNHRRGLHDAVLVKDNHLVGIAPARLGAAVGDMVRCAQALDPPPSFFEIEVDTLDQLRAVLEVPGIDVILLDNFSCPQMTEAVALRDRLKLRERVQLEASGSITLETVRRVAETGVDRIAVGALTHSAPALDIAFDRR
jgi:nicotinate-nucleotide pyrophosphorylase (carboxylating)